MKEGDDIDVSKDKCKEFIESKMNDTENMKKIVQNGNKIFKKYIQKDAIIDYFHQLMISINKNYDFS